MYREVTYTFYPFFLIGEILHITIEQYQNQETGTGRIHRIYSDFTSFTYTYLYVCVQHVILSHVQIHVTITSIKVQNHSINMRLPCVIPLQPHPPLFLSSLIPSPWNYYYSVLCIYTFAISRFLYKWYDAGCNHLGFYFSHSASLS